MIFYSEKQRCAKLRVHPARLLQTGGGAAGGPLTVTSAAGGPPYEIYIVYQIDGYTTGAAGANRREHTVEHGWLGL